MLKGLIESICLTAKNCLTFKQLTPKRGGGTMARPIEPTPVLKGKAAKAFETRIESDLKVPSRLTPTPKLESARTMVKERAKESSKK
jgi:hypothetical protein